MADVTPVVPAPTSPATPPAGLYTGVQGIVYNENVAGLVGRINSIIVEIYKSPSNAAPVDLAADQSRWQSYLTYLSAYVAWVTSQPQEDRPKTSQNAVTLDPLPIITEVDNDDVNDLVRMYQNLRDEIINSASARLPSGMLVYDANRINSSITRIGNFLTAYIAKVTPTDFPASTPNAPLAAPTVQGV